MSSGQDIESVVQVFAELVFGDVLFQVFVGRGDDANINGDGLVGAQWLDLSLLQHPQEFDLHVQGQVANFVQENRAAIGHFKAAHPFAHGTGESAFSVTKQFTFQKFPRDGPTVDGHKGPRSARALGMKGLGNEFFTGAALTLDEHAGQRWRQRFDQRPSDAHGFALANQWVRRECHTVRRTN
ncbi:MAG: hypothetical protein RJA56_1582 [Pseudomonadota bacterium]